MPGVWAPLLLALVACAGEPEIGTSSAAATVADVIDDGCSTSVVIGLSRQIADEVGCMAPDTLVTLDDGNGIVFSGSAVLPYLTPEARADLTAAVAARGGATLQINSAYRTVVQQYLLYRWYQQGRCGITAAATPGGSNHESGRAIDVGNWGEWVGTLGAHGWGHTVPGDEVHFDHLASPDLRGMDVHGFQRLWNRNHPEDLIAEDGDYGPQTEARLRAAPTDGFPIGTCADQPEDDDPMTEGPDEADDDDPSAIGGCSAGGTAAPWLLLALMAQRRFRRRGTLGAWPVRRPARR